MLSCLAANTEIDPRAESKPKSNTRERFTPIARKHASKEARVIIPLVQMGETEARSQEVTCPRSSCRRVAESRREHRSLHAYSGGLGTRPPCL